MPQENLNRANLTIDDIDVVELNKLLLPNLLACKELNINPDINMEGGAIALGHPLGATGTRITAKAALLMVKKIKYALATQCIVLDKALPQF